MIRSTVRETPVTRRFRVQPSRILHEPNGNVSTGALAMCGNRAETVSIATRIGAD